MLEDTNSLDGAQLNKFLACSMVLHRKLVPHNIHSYVLMDEIYVKEGNSGVVIKQAFVAVTKSYTSGTCSLLRSKCNNVTAK